MTEINNNGNSLENKDIYLKLRAIICDAPARAFVCGTIGHTSARDSSKCYEVAGIKNKRLAYSTEIAELRTDIDFQIRKDSEHHACLLCSGYVILEKINKDRLASQKELNADISAIKAALAQQKLLLDKILSTLHPVHKNFNIFPLKTLDEAKKVDEYMSNNSKAELFKIAYVRSIIGKTSLNQCTDMLLTQEALTKVNWDGRQKKKCPVNPLKFFSDILYFAANGPQKGLKHFESLMKKGFDEAKINYIN